jgi:hypothetical protein
MKEKLEGPIVSDSVPRANLYGHLAFKGYVVAERDYIGPLRVLVKSPTELQVWERDSKIKGDFRMKFISSACWEYEKPSK